MPRRDWKILIHDMLKAIDSVRRYTTGMSFEDFAADRKTVDAVVRNLIIIEAACRIPDEVCLGRPEIPWHEVRAMRNFVVHEYFRVSDKILWETIQIDLPPLEGILKKILGI